MVEAQLINEMIDLMNVKARSVVKDITRTQIIRYFFSVFILLFITKLALAFSLFCFINLLFVVFVATLSA